MEALICKNCGGHINRNIMKCEYCGTQYKIENDQFIRVETFQNPVRVYQSEMFIHQDAIDNIPGEDLADIAIKNLSSNLAEAIAPNMDIKTEYDPYMMRQRISARVRIVEPKHMF